MKAQLPLRRCFSPRRDHASGVTGFGKGEVHYSWKRHSYYRKRWILPLRKMRTLRKAEKGQILRVGAVAMKAIFNLTQGSQGKTRARTRVRTRTRTRLSAVALAKEEARARHFSSFFSDRINKIDRIFGTMPLDYLLLSTISTLRQAQDS